MSSERLSYIYKPTDIELTYYTIPERLEVLAKRIGDKEIYVFLNPDGTRESATAAQLYAKAKDLALLLCKLGVKKGDVVVSCLPNNLNSLICTFGIICAGGIVLNTILSRTNTEDLEDTLMRTQAKGLIIEPGNDNEYLKACLKFIEKVNNNGTVSSKSIPSLEYFLSMTAADGIDILSANGSDIDTSDVALPRIDPEGYAIFFNTSGSTGNKKFVPQTHHTAMIIGYQLQESMLFEPDDVIYCERRLIWAGGFPYMYLHNGVKTINKTTQLATLMEQCVFTAKVLENENCTIARLFPTTIIGITDMWKEVEDPKSMLKNIYTSSLPVTDVCMDAIGLYTMAVTNIYGSSEGGIFAKNIIRNKADFTNYCAGIPIRGVELKIVDENGMVVPRGVHGVIHARSPSLFREYFNDEVRTKQVLSITHWMNTDDIGVISTDGKLTVVGRKSDIIAQGGKLFVPSVSEAIIKTHPDVLDVTTISILNEAEGPKLCACVIGKSDRNLTAETIKIYLNALLKSSTEEALGTTIPEHILIYENYPRLNTGKPDKFRLKADAIARLKGE